MSEFDDQDLRNRLGRLSGDFPDSNTALVVVGHRVRRARRRRAAITGSAAIVALLATGALLAIGNGESTNQLTPTATPPEASTTLGPSGSSTTTTGPSVTARPTTTVGSAPGPTTPAITAAPGTTTAASMPATPTTTSSTSTPTTSPPPTTAPTTTNTFTSIGGSVTVRLEGGQLTLLGTSPAAGFTADVSHGGGNRVEVRFESADHESRVRVDIENGQMAPTITES